MLMVNNLTGFGAAHAAEGGGGGTSAGLLLHGDEDPFTDAAGNTLTLIGGAPFIVRDNQAGNFGGFSIKLQIGGSITTPSSADFDCSVPFTWEMRHYLLTAGSTYRTLMALDADINSGHSMFQNASGYLECYMAKASNPATWWTIQSSITIPVNQWATSAMVYDGTYLKLYINGTSAGQVLIDAAPKGPSGGKLHIGKLRDDGLYPNQGWFEEIRIKPEVVYTEAYTPATEAFPNP
jgi:hypothetical protein